MFHDSSGPRRLKPMLDELRRADLGQAQGRAGARPLRARARRRVAPHRRASRATGPPSSSCRTCYDSQGICHIVRAAARPHPARHVLRRRRLAFAHRRRVRRLHVRHRRHRDARRGGHRRDLAARCRRRSSCNGTAALAAGVSAKDMMLRHARPLRHERRPLPGGGVLRRGGARAVDGRAHDAGQHERRTRRAGRPGRARRRHARLAGRARRRRLGHRHLRTGTATPAAPTRPTTSTPPRSRRRSRCRTARPTCRR